jgi:hypothetical protein
MSNPLHHHEAMDAGPSGTEKATSVSPTENRNLFVFFRYG